MMTDCSSHSCINCCHEGTIRNDHQEGDTGYRCRHMLTRLALAQLVLCYTELLLSTPYLDYGVLRCSLTALVNQKLPYLLHERFLLVLVSA